MRLSVRGTILFMVGESAIKLGRYTLLDELGRGSMAVVYRAKDTVLSRDVALKVIEPVEDDAESADTLRQFVGEARTAAQLDHPNIVRVFDITRSQGRVAIAMELCTGGSLADRLKMDGALPWRMACNIIADAAEGLAYAHQQRIVHRDIKPANLMFSAQGQCKVADFGLARSTDHREVKHLQGKVVGTPYYTAPEQLRHLKLTPASDLYSLGITLWVTITGSPTFQASTTRRVYRQHLKGTVPDLTELAPDTPPALAELLHQLLAKQPQDRPQHADEVARTLRQLATSPEVSDTSDTPDTSAPRPIKNFRKPRRSYAGVIGAAVSVCLVFAVGLVVWWDAQSNVIVLPQTPVEAEVEAEAEAEAEVEAEVEVEVEVASLIRKKSLIPQGSLIDHGEPTDGLIQRGNWVTHSNMIEGSGMNSDLTLRLPIAGDGRVRIRMSLSKIKGTIASLMIDGQSKFCFDGRGGVLYVKGPVFGHRRVHKLGESEGYFQPNVPFELELTRHEGELSIAIDQREVYRGPDDRVALGTLSLHAHRNVMRVYEWHVNENAPR